MRFAAFITLIFILPIFTFASSLVNINTADAPLLDTLPGIGPAKATAIVDYRTKNGPFATIEDIQNVSGIGPATYANLKEQITVGTSAAKQPSPDATSYEKVQAVDQITSTTNDVPNDQAIAPAAAAKPAAAGAALPQTASTPHETPAAGLFSSPWIWGLLGVILIAGGAFILI